MSPTLEESLGYPADEWTRPGFIRRLVYPEDLDSLMGVWQQVARTRQPLTLQFRAVSAQGRLVPLDVELNALDLRTGGGEGVLGIVRDLPNRQPAGPDPGTRHEENLRETLARGLPEPAWLVGRDLSVEWCSPPSPTTGAVEVVCSAARQAAPQAWTTAHQRALQGRAGGFDVTTRGHTYRCRVAPVKDAQDGVVAAVGVATDISDLAEMAQALTRFQQERAELIDNIDGVVWEATAADFHFTFVSKQAERLLGYPTRCWLEEPDFWVNHLHADDRTWAPAFCVKATEECRPHELEYRMVAADGRTVWLRDIVTVIVEGHRPLKLRGIMVDVTEQHWNRERLQHMVSLLRATLDSTTDGLLVVNLNGRITASNRRFQDLWRIPDELMDSRRYEPAVAHILDQLQHPEQYLALVRKQEAAPEAESFDDLELLDGRVIERSSTPQRQGEDIIGRVWSFRDVTQRVRAERERDRLLVAEKAARVAAEESYALLDTFLNNAPIGLAFLDRDLRVLRVNDTLATLHGRPQKDEVGLTVREALPDMAHLIEPRMRQVLDTGEPIIDVELTGEYPSSPGVKRTVRVSYYPVQTSSGGIVGVGAVVVDVTAERRAQAERERLLTEAHEAIRVRDDFLSIASHELKTPLTPLTLHLQMLKQRATAGQPAPSPLVEKTLAQVKRLSELINDLLDTSRIEAGRLELEPEPIRIRELIREILADFRQSSVRHELRCEEPEEDLVVQGDRNRLAQVLTNLLENAIKYSPTGGPVRVTCARRGAEVLISVSDSGIGIPADQQEHLFERFFRARNAPISGFGGLGLGLYICRDIVERHGGHIWVESEAGQGSTFHFTLPLASDTDRAPTD